MIGWLLFGMFLSGVISGHFFLPGREEIGCSNELMGYPCRGSRCDHSEKTWYQTKADMAADNDDDNPNLTPCL